MIPVTREISLGEAELQFDCIRASGPGGQNVNKVSTAVQLRFDAAHSPALTPEVRQRLRHLAGSRMTRAGVLIINARRFRTQQQNRRDAQERLVALIREAALRPAVRRPTRPSAAARRRRREAKHQRALLKSRRRAPGSHPGTHPDE